MFIGAVVGIVLAVGVFGAVAWQRMDQSGSGFDASRLSSQTSPVGETSVKKANAETDAQPNYRYSVVPGGVRSPEELIEAMAKDSVVAEHYSGIDKAKMTSGKLNEPLKAHVSYRIGDRVYWTNRKITIQAGEQVLTDGKTLVRGRCGNAISVDPLLPTLANEPEPEVFDAIVPPGSTNALVQLDPAHSFFTAPGLKTPQAPAGSSAALSGNSPSGSGFPSPPPPGNSGTPGTSSNPQADPNSVPPGGDPPVDPPGNPPCVSAAASTSGVGNSSAVSAACGPGDNPPGGNPPGGDPPGGDPKGDPPDEFPPNDVPNAPTPVPEPGTLLLVGAGAAALLARRIRKQKP